MGTLERRAQSELTERLRSRRGEIEAAVRERVDALADTERETDPSYAQGLRTAVAAGLEYGLAALEASEEHPPQVPVELLAQARLAARNGVGIDIVLRRYFGGYVLLGEFIAQEAAAADLPSADLKRLMHVQAMAFDRLLAAVSEEHGRELEKGRRLSSSQRHAERVRRLLAGEPAEVSDLPYDFEGHHLGLVAVGEGAEAAVHELAAALDRVPFAVRPEPDALWAWLGGRRALEAEALERALSAQDRAPLTLALGEGAAGLAGWRLTHRQALAALPVAQRGPEPVVRYVDVALLAAALQDDLLATSLRRLYLEPLEAERDGGQAARETLRAYFAADRNASSAAAALGFSRNTVAKRLRAIETAIGRPLSSCGPELEAALRLVELSRPIAS